MQVALATPTYDGKLGVPYVLGLTSLIAHRRLAMPFFLAGCSNVSLARNKCAKWYLQGGWEHLVFIDADMGFSEADWDLLMEGEEECVACEYRKKDQAHRVRVLYGLGFARIARSCFERMGACEREDGALLLNRFRMDGEEWVDYFPQGPTGDGVWRGEDHGFWLMARLAGASVRIERRTALMHTGDAHYIYRAEDFPDELSAFGIEPITPQGTLPDPNDINF